MGGILRDFAEFRGIRRNFAGFGGIWRDLAGLGIRRDFAGLAKSDERYHFSQIFENVKFWLFHSNDKNPNNLWRLKIHV